VFNIVIFFRQHNKMLSYKGLSSGNGVSGLASTALTNKQFTN